MTIAVVVLFGTDRLVLSNIMLTCLQFLVINDIIISANKSDIPMT